MKTHELKLDIKYFHDVKTGKMKFNIRKNDRDFQVGDVLELKAWEKDSFVFWRATSSENHDDYWQTCLKERADTIKAKVTWVLDIFENSWESGRKMAETVPGTGDDLVELNIDIGIVLREYFSTDRLPDGYVIFGIEVVK